MKKTALALCLLTSFATANAEDSIVAKKPEAITFSTALFAGSKYKGVVKDHWRGFNSLFDRSHMNIQEYHITFDFMVNVDQVMVSLYRQNLTANTERNAHASVYSQTFRYEIEGDELIVNKTMRFKIDGRRLIDVSSAGNTYPLILNRQDRY